MRTRSVERILFGAGLLLVGISCGAWVHGTLAAQSAIQRFQKVQVRASVVSAAAMTDPISGSRVDFALWSEKRTREYKDSLAQKMDLPLAVLRIPKISLEVPVFNDTDDLILNRGVGRILGTARVGETGNLGIAGHRDGFFRGLKDLEAGDEIDLLRPSHTDKYVVENIQVVSPNDVSVLNPTQTPYLTLVTCFPFYYIGSAPQRYIVRASMKGLAQDGR
jgi:sortase A